MTPEEFQKNIAAARNLCNESVSRQINEKAKGVRNNINPGSFDDVPPVRGTAEDDAWDRMFLSDAALNESSSPSAPMAETRQPAIQMTQASVSKSRVPDFIKNSMINERIDITALSANPLDRMDLSGIQINEERPAAPVTRTIPAGQTNNTGIDYSVLRAIILECIDSKFKELGITKEILSENTLKSIHLSKGNINLIDNKGNIFGAKLEIKGNVNNNG